MPPVVVAQELSVIFQPNGARRFGGGEEELVRLWPLALISG